MSSCSPIPVLRDWSLARFVCAAAYALQTLDENAMYDWVGLSGHWSSWVDAACDGAWAKVDLDGASVFDCGLRADHDGCVDDARLTTASPACQGASG